MSVSFCARVVVPEDVLMRELEGEAVILDLRSGEYFGLNEVGTRMWALLASNENIESAYQVLQEEFEVDPEVLRHDLADLVGQLQQRGLIEVEGV